MSHAPLDAVINTVLTASLIFRATAAAKEMDHLMSQFQSQWLHEFTLHQCGREAAAIANFEDAAKDLQQEQPGVTSALQKITTHIHAWPHGELTVDSHGCDSPSERLEIRTYRLDESHERHKRQNWSYRLVLKDEV